MKKIVLLLLLIAVSLFVFAVTAQAEDQIGGAYMYRVSAGKAIITSFDNSQSGALTIPDRLRGYTVTEIEDSVFFGCDSITSVVLPGGLVRLGADVFSECTNLEQVTFSSVLTHVGDKAFYNCKKLKEVNLPDTLQSVGESAFDGCEAVKSISLGASVTEIGAAAFRKCKALEGISLPPKLTVLKDNTFYGCEAIREIELPEALTEIGSGTFRNCKSLESILLHEGISSVGVDAFNGCSALLNLSFPQSLVSVGQSALAGTAWLNARDVGVVYVGKVAYGICGAAPSVLSIQEGTVSVSDGAFASVMGIEVVCLPSTLVSLGARAFAFSTQIREIVLPKTLSVIGEKAFFQCFALEKVYFEGSDASKDCLSFGLDNEAVLSAEWQFGSCLKNQGTYLHEFSDESAPCSHCGVLRYVSGDLDENESVTAADAIYLLYHTLFGETRYPVNQPVDYDGDGIVNSSDAIYLLYHSLFGGGRYPI